MRVTIIVMNDTEQMKGMEKRAAQNFAERKNLIFRLVSVNGETYLGKPEDARSDRVCVEIVDNRVENAYIG